MRTRQGNFYYGYEYVVCPKHGPQEYNNPAEGCNSDECDASAIEWAFRAELESRIIQVSYSDIATDACRDRFNCGEVLLVGIGWILQKYNLDVWSE